MDIKEVWRINTPINGVSQIVFGYKQDDISWKCRYLNRVIEVLDEDINNKWFEKTMSTNILINKYER